MHYTAQVKGSAKIIVTVVATRELEPGDVLRRFKAAQDGLTRSSRCGSALSAWNDSRLHVGALLFSRVIVCVC